MAIFDWNPDLAPKGIAFNRRGMTVGGPTSLAGRTQVGQFDAGYWIATLQRMPVGGPVGVKAFRRQMALLEGGAHQILVPVFDVANAPWPVAGVHETAPSDFTDDTDFTDGTGFYEPTIKVSLATAAALRATRIEATETAVAEIVGGEYFSVGIGRLHMITRVISDGVWQIWPPLREALPAGAELNFDNPKCLMRLVNEGGDDLSLEMGRIGYPDIEFIEVIE